MIYPVQLFVVLAFIVVLFFGCSSKTVSPETRGEFPLYGNWCGPAHPIDGTNPIPIDPVDDACRKHDICYQEKGYFSCACDERLMKRLFRLKQDKWRGRYAVSGDEYKNFEKPIVSSIRAYFALTGCNPISKNESNIFSMVALPFGTVITKTGTILDTGTSFIGESFAFVIDKVYYVVQLPFLLLGKGICLLVNEPCYAIDVRISSGQGVKKVFIRR